MYFSIFLLFNKNVVIFVLIYVKSIDYLFIARLFSLR